MWQKDNSKTILSDDNENEEYYDNSSRIRGRNDNQRDPLEYDCFESGFSGVKSGEIRIKHRKAFKGMNKRIVLVFLMRLAGFTTKQICPICKISPRTATRYVKLVYAKYPHLKNI